MPANIPLDEETGAHDFRAAAPNEKWVSDITEFRLPDAPKVYLSPIVDLFDSKPVAWSIGLHPDHLLADSSLLKACATLRPGEHPFCHTDRGCHYRWPGWKRICAEHGVVRSMSRKGRSPDNARGGRASSAGSRTSSSTAGTGAASRPPSSWSAWTRG